MREHAKFAIGLAAFCGAGLAFPAHAIFNITSTDIREGLFAVEMRNRFDSDDRASKDDNVMHAFKAEYGISKRWGVEVIGYLQDVPQHGYRYTSAEFENKLRFYDPGDYWLDFALKLSYERKEFGDDQVKAKFLFQKELAPWEHVFNINLAKEIGRNDARDAELTFGWRTKYALHPHFEPGFEFYSSFGELVDMPDYNGQSHRIGPMFYGRIAPGLKYQAGYLFGISQAAEDGSFKLFLRYEFSL